MESEVTITPNKLFKEQLEEIGPEFAIAMEKYRESHFGDIFRYLVYTFKLESELAKMNDQEQQQFIDMCKIMHNYGFYGGVSFTLDPDKEYEEHIIYH